MGDQQKLYKRDNTGATRVWWVEINGNVYRQNSGQVDGKITQSSGTICHGKNIGRSNATTDNEQCRLEVKALYEKKLKRGYTKNKEEIDQAKDKLISPMLAHRYEDHSHKLNWKQSIYSQPKLDGIRCIARVDGLWTRKGEPILTVPHIAPYMMALCHRTGLTFDGELYNHDLKDDFNLITSLVRRQKSSPEHAANVYDVVQYHIYDLVDQGTLFRDRKRLLDDVLKTTKHIKRVETTRVTSQEGLDAMYEAYIKIGYEGQMVRTNELYQAKRTAFLLKRKEWQDDEFVVLNILEGKGNRSGMVGKIVYKTHRGVKFTAALEGTNDHRIKVLKDKKKYIGKLATVKFFHYTPDGSPRFPSTKYIHD